MTRRITPEQIKLNNRQLIYEYIYSQKGCNVSQNEISKAFHMSRPTVAGNLSALEKDGLIFRSGLLEADQPGRKSVTWSIAEDYRIALGVEILKHSVKIIAVNLYGHALKCAKFKTEYSNNEKYYGHITGKVKEFISSLEINDPSQKILGIGFALQGLVSEDGSKVIYGEILKCTGLTIDVFTKRLDYPCRFVHEPDGAAVSELWVSPELDSAVYLSMSEHLGGALIHHRKVLNGMHRHSATFEHITACPDGNLCYCGKRGCYETVCSKVALLKGEDPDEFFRRVRNGEGDAPERWRVFLCYLGRLIAHLHLVADTKFILGGHLAPYFTADDIDVLYKHVREMTPFVENNDYILLSKMPSHNITIGAALPYVMKFLEGV
ncbi:MAG: ROK family transcriptional regulator [Synergistaceae bacterium]|nr:ROK family transcriptional regulator [Synergistaceae bacterium]